MSLDFIFRHVLCSHEDVSFNKNQVSQYENAHKRGSGLIRVNLNSSNASICTQFITALRTLNPKQRCCRDKLVFLYLCSLLLANSYAPEPNPGPRHIKFPCVICEKAVRWNTPGVCCDSCDRWYKRDVWECQKKYTVA